MTSAKNSWSCSRRKRWIICGGVQLYWVSNVPRSNVTMWESAHLLETFYIMTRSARVIVNFAELPSSSFLNILNLEGCCNIFQPSKYLHSLSLYIYMSSDHSVFTWLQLSVFQVKILNIFKILATSCLTREC